MKIELYINSKQGTVKGADAQCLPPMGRCGMDRKPGSFQAKETFISYSDKETKIKELLEDLASKHNLELKIYDISNNKDALHARTKGISNTPTVIIDNQKLDDDFEPKDIIKHIFGEDASNAGYKDESKKYICPKCQSADIKTYDDLSGFCNACNEPFMKGKESE